ncbi:uncharacterized protein LODBEIA_P25510 [Lodderomyces beijingensis]|uniref:GAF domain-containing protein n=1 Tax=Lodderomyces beijingensis TaxID=1775926 RepID=A0ABP0ZQ58_9ASCO
MIRKRPLKANNNAVNNSNANSQSFLPTLCPSNSTIILPYQNKNELSTKPPALISAGKDLTLIPIHSTKSHFLDAYSKGKWNLSKVPCPHFMENTGYMKPPESFNEISRLDAVSRYMNLPQWKNSSYFTKITSKLKKTFKVCGVSISLIDNYKCHFKIETLLDASSVPRCVAIDSHAILSSGYFTLLDASKDWRTSANPLITGVPYIRFYCGVPLLAENNEAVGILAVFDKTPRNAFGEEARKILKMVSRETMDLLNTPLEPPRRSNYFEHVTDSLLLYGNKDKKKALSDLQREIGRPTSGRSSLVFDKDGSGGPYTQNQTFRFVKYGQLERTTSSGSIDQVYSQRRYSTDQSERNPNAPVTDKEIWQLLFSVGSLKKAATALSRVIATKYNFEFVYILEIRVAEPCSIPRECFPPGDEIVAFESFAHSAKVVKSEGAQDEFMTREIGSYSRRQPNGDKLTQACLSGLFENSIHYKAFISEFGLEYKNLKMNTVYNSGLIMPFFRHDAKLVRRSNALKESKSNVIDLYLRSGGFLIAMFSERIKETNSELISNLFNHACTYRKIYIAT